MTRKSKRGFVIFMTAFVLICGLKYFDTMEDDFEVLAVAAEVKFNGSGDIGDAVYVNQVPEETEEVLPPVVVPKNN